jgi:hypothetical protein
MSREICHVHIRWLEPGDSTVILEVAEASNRLSYWLTERGWTCDANPEFYTELCKRELLRSLYRGYGAGMSLSADYSVVNPVVVVKVPVAVFDLTPSPVSHCGWLKDSIDNIGVYDTFKKYIPDLENIGLWLRLKGKAQHQGIYGTVLDFYAAWDFEPWQDSDGDWDVKTTFCGWFDLASAVMQHCSLPPKTERQVVVNKC